MVNRLYYWSYDGTGGASSHLWRVRTDGSNQEQVTFFSSGTVLNFDVSQDGGYVAYEGEGTGGARDLLVMDIDGSNNTRLSDTPYWEANPNFNSELEQITNPPTGQSEFEACFGKNDEELFICCRIGPSTSNDEIVKHTIATDVTIQLTSNNVMDQYPDWHPGD